MLVDSYRFLPRSFVSLYDAVEPLAGEAEPVWTALPGRLAASRIALLTSAGLFVEGEQPSFDLERERREPHWGDPGLRVLPAELGERRLGMAHLHVNATDILADRNVALPVDVLDGLVHDGVVGGATARHVSVMGYQEAGLEVWRGETAPAIAALLREEGADGVVLSPV